MAVEVGGILLKADVPIRFDESGMLERTKRRFVGSKLKACLRWGRRRKDVRDGQVFLYARMWAPGAGSRQNR